MASEQIGNLYPTLVPGYDDAADIQAALRMYHYGSDSYDINNSNSNPINLPASSIAGNFAALEADISDLQNTTISGKVSSAEPTTNLKDGYVWLDSDGTNANGPYSATSIYQPTAPVVGLANGLIWIKKGVDPLEMYVYNSTSSEWDQVI
jgi:hypothetical protein